MSTITRVFRVQIFAELREKFEPLFQSASLAAIIEAKGFIEASTGKPTQWAPNEYVLSAQGGGSSESLLPQK